MALSYKARRMWSIVALLIGLPIYIAVAVTVTNLAEGYFGRLPILIELVVYVVLGVAWIIPLKPVFSGIGKPDPDAPPSDK
ncbi:hypothetical protein BFP70_11495 [Thioclava sp. SK-1]|uniref:DUF2842 domain-containing protein n=1 Tax=Thioclava sp. SK-1 TaxID=1889770 RepID=UPI0008254FBD|nr:DUF2842 domain-containing protein [Thioclava sp. SK-1]OCX64633.1 hypothetical protein BFP70_11495 [Thioclava sp. SK-1]